MASTTWAKVGNRSRSCTPLSSEIFLVSKELNLPIIEVVDNRWHAAKVKVFGIAVPKEDLEKGASIIRDNPEKFRIGEQFYSEEEKKKIKK